MGSEPVRDWRTIANSLGRACGEKDARIAELEAVAQEALETLEIVERMGTGQDWLSVVAELRKVLGLGPSRCGPVKPEEADRGSEPWDRCAKCEARRDEHGTDAMRGHPFEPKEVCRG